jgi:transcriptional regulator of arginine metabolism
VSDGKGRQKYAVLGREESQLDDRYIRVLREGFASMDMAQNLVVIKTVSGMAMAVAAALDAMKFPEVLGCIAGDDTIMVASRTVEEAGELIHKIQGMLEK